MSTPRGLYVAILVAMGVGWGSTQPLGKIAAATGHPPFGMLLWQTVFGTVTMAVICIARRTPLPMHGRALRFYGIVALIGTVIPNFTFYYSIARLPSGIMSIIISTIPMIALVIGVVLGGENVTVRRLMGLLLGLAGVLMIALPQASLPDRAMLAFLPVAMVGPLFYAMESTYVARTGLMGMDPLQAMLGAQIAAFMLCVPAVLITGQGMAMPLIPGVAEWALIVSSVLHALLYATFIWLASKTGAVFASQTSYVVTIAGLLVAMAVLGERFSPWVFAAAGVMLCGIALVRPRGADLQTL